ncbi:MAG: TolC family protein [Bryobacteraceae bacterium]|jgi:cobalt-zinc-cadmium efflux system outer membrane protein
MSQVVRSFCLGWSGLGRLCSGALLAVCFAHCAGAQTYTWQELRQKFEKTNPTLLAGEDNIAESRAMEITAFLRPNPDFSLAIDGTQLASYDGVYRPFAGTQYSPAFSYLHERQNKRELRLESAKKGTSIAESQQEDLKRNLLFNLRSAFVTALQAKAVLDVAKENLVYYDHVLEISQEQLKAGDIAKVDMMRLDLQRVQYESDIQSALVNVRTAKIQLLALLNDRTPVDRFDVTGPFDFTEVITTLDDIHRIALDARPDLRAAIQAVDKAKTDHQLAVSNGSTDPTWSVWITHNPSFNNPFDNNTIGASVDIPLRLFDRNQGEKERTEIDIRRNQRLRDAATAQVYSDVDSAWATVESNVALLRPYKAKYLEEAASVRDTITFSYQRGGASLLDFLSAENDYRSVRLNYLNLVGAYLTAASQLNLAVGREVITQ